ncbi:MAG: 4-hydroxy-tetrahydrodipicolinate reductase [Gammaproteobacteria bacterium]
MIRIYINGASGKMGQSLSKLIESDDQFQSVSENDFSLSDVVVDFSNPISTLKILKKCLEINAPIVIGTTGFNDDEINEIKNAGSKIPILLAANFSLGVSSLKESLEYFIKTLDQDMRCLIEETHHIEKLDEPSGTAIELKNLITSIDKNNNIKTIKIKSVRKKDVFGLHKVTFHNQNKTTYFMHEALSREVFAKGALFSSNAIMKMKPNVYNFKDILN